jgi:hypothetical protein
MAVVAAAQVALLELWHRTMAEENALEVVLQVLFAEADAGRRESDHGVEPVKTPTRRDRMLGRCPCFYPFSPAARMEGMYRGRRDAWLIFMLVLYSREAI